MMLEESPQQQAPLIAKIDKEWSMNSLPYHEGALTKEQKQEANQLIEEEMKRFPKMKNYLADFPTESDKWMTPAAKKMLSMVANNQPLDVIDEAKYAVPEMESLEKKDPQDLIKYIELFEAQLMYADHRRMQLGLLIKHGPASYRQESTAFKVASDNINRKATELKKEIFEIHHERKRQHQSYGEKLKNLEDEFQQEVEKVNNLRKAIDHAKQQLEKNLKDIENIEV